ncbi:hypothetical protein [Acinetobacter ursingii]|uniref:hypothetical protein n=1 Tax=Acinetobacter ursingii TaxID=108980 RepID=UPI00300943E2
MFHSQDSLDYGYADLYNAYHTTPFLKELVKLTKASFIAPNVFSAQDPQHVCLAAKYSLIIYPPNSKQKEWVQDDSPYSKTIATRIANFKEFIKEFNAKQKRIAPFCGVNIIVKIEDDVPFTLEQFEMYGLGDTDLAKAALQYEKDRKFLALSHARRLDHFAQHYGFTTFQELKEFLNKLDITAQQMGYKSYSEICTSAQYMKGLEDKYKDQADIRPALDALRHKRDFLMRESTFIIESFFACRIPEFRKSYYVDMNSEGVIITLYEGKHQGIGIVSSQFISSKSERFHDEWFNLNNGGNDHEI